MNCIHIFPSGICAYVNITNVKWNCNFILRLKISSHYPLHYLHFEGCSTWLSQAGHSSRYWPGLTLLVFSDRRGTSVIHRDVAVWLNGQMRYPRLSDIYNLVEIKQALYTWTRNIRRSQQEFDFGPPIKHFEPWQLHHSYIHLTAPGTPHLGTDQSRCGLILVIYNNQCFKLMWSYVYSHVSIKCKLYGSSHSIKQPPTEKRASVRCV